MTVLPPTRLRLPSVSTDGVDTATLESVKDLQRYRLVGRTESNNLKFEGTLDELRKFMEWSQTTARYHLMEWATEESTKPHRWLLWTYGLREPFQLPDYKVVPLEAAVEDLTHTSHDQLYRAGAELEAFTLNGHLRRLGGSWVYERDADGRHVHLYRDPATSNPLAQHLTPVGRSKSTEVYYHLSKPLDGGLFIYPDDHSPVLKLEDYLAWLQGQNPGATLKLNRHGPTAFSVGLSNGLAYLLLEK